MMTTLSLGLGDGLGTVTFSGNSVNAGGVDMVKDIVPTAYTAGMKTQIQQTMVLLLVLVEEIHLACGVTKTLLVI